MWRRWELLRPVWLRQFYNIEDMWKHIQFRNTMGIRNFPLFWDLFFSTSAFSLIFKCTFTCFQGTPAAARTQSNSPEVLKCKLCIWMWLLQAIFEPRFRSVVWTLFYRQLAIENLFRNSLIFHSHHMTTQPIDNVTEWCLQCSCSYTCQGLQY